MGCYLRGMMKKLEYKGEENGCKRKAGAFKRLLSGLRAQLKLKTVTGTNVWYLEG